MRFRPISIFAFPMDGELTKPSASAIHLVHPLTHSPTWSPAGRRRRFVCPTAAIPHLLKSTQVSPISIKIIIIIYALPLYWTTHHHPHLHTHPQNVPGI